MSGSVQHLVFVGRESSPLTTDELSSFSQAATEVCRSQAVTGILLYGGGNVLGVLEGGRLAVFRCYENILADKRLTATRQLLVEPVASSLFTSWSAGVLDSPPEASLSIPRLEQLAVTYRERKDAPAGGTTIALLRDFQSQLARTSAASPAPAPAPSAAATPAPSVTPPPPPAAALQPAQATT